MPGRVVDEGEIFLDGIYYPVVGAVQPTLVSVYPPKLVLGDTTKDSQTRASVIAWNGWQAGLGVECMTEQDKPGKTWWSTCQLRIDHHLTLPRLAVITAASGVSGVFTIGAIGELASEIYAAFGTAVRKYNNVTDSWGSTLATLPAGATHALNFVLGSTEYLAFATGGGYTYTSDGVAWTDDTTDTRYLAFWDDRLWGLDAAGQLWRATVVGTETNDAIVPVPSGNITSLFVGRNAAGTIVLYCMTRRGLYQHTAATPRWEATDLALPLHPDNGVGSNRWRDSMYIAAGLTVYRYINGENSAVVIPVGPDLDHGLPLAQQGRIIQLVGTHNELMSLIDGTTPSAEVDMFDGSAMGSHIASVINVDTGYSEILGWTEKSWETKWLAAANTAAADAMYASYAYSTHRLYWAHNQRIYYMALPTGLVNPTQLTSFAYAASAEHITPWVVLGAKDITALALALHVEVTQATVNETVVVDYATNYSATYTNLGTISTDGTTTYLFPNSTTPSGTDFRTIRFRLTLARGTVNTNTPDIRSLTFVYRKKLRARWGFAAILDLTREWKGRSPRQQQDSLVTTSERNTLVEFTMHSDTSAGDPRNYYVDVLPSEGAENTGFDFTGNVRVTLAEP